MTVMTNNVEKEHVEPVSPDEIDLIEVFRKIWDGRKTIYKTVAIFFVIGIIIVLGTPKEYKSEVTLLVETQSKNNGMSGLLQQVTGLSGLNLGGANSGQDALSPQLYPDIVKSTPFLLEIMKQKIVESTYDSTITVADYLERYTKSSLISNVLGYTIGIPFRIINIFRSKSVEKQLNEKNKKLNRLIFTKRQLDIAGQLSGVIKVKDGESSGILIIGVELQDAYVAAQLTDSVVKNLTQYIIDYRTQKAHADFIFINNRHSEAKSRYINSQLALATYNDRNKNIILASVQSEQQRLQSEYNLEFGIYNALSQQLEQAKLKVQENTPVFKVINPARVAFQKSKPNTNLILMAMVFFGAFVGICIIVLKWVIKNSQIII